MSVLYLALPISLIFGLIAVIIFALQAKRGQFDDLETPPMRMLFDDAQVKKSRTEEMD